ncbi:McrC family protein [Aliarcobacter butzleri]|uniref:5-methylcytosine restriction system specificity protein McrC n=1 Tax=Aliarcobacter butzleri TaxID=28197 RepID=UPI001260C3A0|nr:restriction endonuclease [Aliarcobacter butzleri]MCT7566717.1 McrC family protein [Aliarcobacter butzleri]
MNNQNQATISEFGLIGWENEPSNKFLSVKIDKPYYDELESFAKTDKGKDVLQFTGNGRYLQAKSYVGTIQTTSGFILEILPKTVKKDVEEEKKEQIKKSKEVFMKLLHLLYKLPNYKNIDSANFERIKDLDIFEIFIFMFLEEVGIIIKKGIKSDYVGQKDNLFYLKGKLLINEQIKRNSIHKERFYVQYDDYNQNRPENRLIKSTLKLLSNISRDFDNQRKIRQYLEHMNWIELSLNVDKDFSMVKTGRGMEHYKNALIWSKVFLKKESFSSFSGDTVAFAILYPMEKLFECFVQWWLEKKYPHLQIEAQNGGYDFVKNLFTVRPDFLIKKYNQVICVADAKWKLIENNKDFSQSDFYQLFAYKHIFLKHHKENNCELTNLKIYYPKSDFLQKDTIFEYFKDEGEIKIVPLDIEYELLK